MKKGIFVILLVLGVATLCSCKGKEEEQVKEQQKESIQIGFSFDSMVIERWQKDRDVFVSVAENMGAKVNVQNAHGDSKEQIKQLEYLIEQNMDVIVLIANNTNDLKQVTEKAREKGIKVIAYDRLIEDTNVDLYISFDNEKVGELMAQEMVRKLPDGGNVGVVFGSPVDHNVKMVEEGFDKIIKKSKINVVEKTYAENWLGETAFNAVSEYIKNEDKINGIVCGNDDLASQAIRALSEHRLAGTVVVVGQDADLSACQRIVEGTQSMTVFKGVDTLAKEAAIAAVTLAKGQEYKTEETFKNGSYEIPYKKFEPIAVTRSNIDKIIIDSGFHLKEDVYLNMPK